MQNWKNTIQTVFIRSFFYLVLLNVSCSFDDFSLIHCLLITISSMSCISFIIQGCGLLFDVACSLRSVLHISIGKWQNVSSNLAECLPPALNPMNVPSMVKFFKKSCYRISYPMQSAAQRKVNLARAQSGREVGLIATFVLILFPKAINFCFRGTAVHHFNHSIVSYKAFCYMETRMSAHMLGASGPTPLRLLHFSECFNICLQ